MTAGASGRGFQRLCIRELDGPRQHDLLDGINLHLRFMDLQARRRRQAPRPSPRRFRSSSGLFHFGDNDRSACQKIYAARDVQSNSDFATSRIRFKPKPRFRDRVLSEFLQKTEFFSNKAPEHDINLSRIQLGVHSEYSKEDGSFSVRSRQHGNALSGTARKIS